MRIGVELAVEPPSRNSSTTSATTTLTASSAFGYRTQLSLSGKSGRRPPSPPMYTTTPRIGVGVMAPYHRNPAVIAHGAATLDQLSGGRVDLSLGRGSRPYIASIDADRPDEAVTEAITIINGLLAGETVSMEGVHSTTRKCPSGFSPSRTTSQSPSPP